MKKIIVLTLLLYPFREVMAQNCSQNLADATRSYYNGQFREVTQKLDGCIEELSKEEKTQGLKLLVDTHLVLGETEKADEYMYELLSVDPDFKSSETDLVEFQNLYNSYLIVSRFALGIQVGYLRPDYRIVKHQSNSGSTQEPSDYQELDGFLIGLTGEVPLYRNFYLSAGSFFEQRGFKQQEIILGMQSIRSTEREYRLNIPLQLKYTLPIKQFRPFISAGYSYHYLFKARADIERIPLAPEILGASSGIYKSADNYDVSFNRRRSTLNWVFNVGTQMIIKGGYLLGFDLSYEWGLWNLIEEEKRFEDQFLVNELSYVPDDYKVSCWMLSVKFMKHYTKPRKK